MTKHGFDQALEIISEQRPLSAADVRADALRRKVWVAEWHLPGCLSESWCVVLTKQAAIQCALDFMNDEEVPPRGAATALRKWGRFDSKSRMFGSCINTIERRTLGSLL